MSVPDERASEVLWAGKDPSLDAVALLETAELHRYELPAGVEHAAVR